jgi:hypothetical protein
MIERTSITGHYSDATKPIIENIIGVYDEKNKEFLFSFKGLYSNNSDTTRQGRHRLMRTLSFSEMFQDFGSYYSYDPERYFAIQEDLYSLRVYQPVVEDDPLLQGWLHDSNSERCLFYNRKDDTVLRLKFGKDYTSKQWDNMQLNQNGTDWTSVRYWTDRQYAVQEPFINPSEEWYAPKYYRGQWDISIRRADGNKGHLNTAEDEGSIMEGTGLLVEFKRSASDAFVGKVDDDLPDRGYSGVALIIKSILVFCTKTFR